MPSLPTSNAIRHRKSWREYFKEEVATEWSDSVLLLGCLATGILDSAVFNAWSCFVSMQTGNTVYVGLGMTGQPYSQPTRWIKSGTSILAFILGSLLFSRLMSSIGPLKRIALLLATSLQAALTLAAALVATFHPHIDAPLRSSYFLLLPLTLLALQAGGQCVLSRVLGYNEVPTVVLTSSYCDIAMDPKLLVLDNTKRNRRAASIVLLLAGAGIGGLLTRDGTIGKALWMVVGLKVVMSGIWLFWPAKQLIRLE